MGIWLEFKLNGHFHGSIKSVIRKRRMKNRAPRLGLRIPPVATIDGLLKVAQSDQNRILTSGRDGGWMKGEKGRHDQLPRRAHGSRHRGQGRKKDAEVGGLTPRAEHFYRRRGWLPAGVKERARRRKQPGSYHRQNYNMIINLTHPHDSVLLSLGVFGLRQSQHRWRERCLICD
jgi:hypothetical protein